jgi:hypothetical protein
MKMTIRGISSVVAASVLSVGLATASASVVAQYNFEEFTSTTYASAPPPYLNSASSSLGTATDLTSVGLSSLQAERTRDATNVPLDSFALLVGAGSVRSGDPVSTDDYLGFTVSADGPLMFTEFSFDFGASSGTTSTVSAQIPHNASAQLFYSVNSGDFLPIGARQDRHAPYEEFTGMINSSIDLSSLPTLSAGDTVEFRLGLSNDRGSATTNVGIYLDNVMLEGVIPEPGALSLLGLAGLGLLARRRRQG